MTAGIEYRITDEENRIIRGMKPQHNTDNKQLLELHPINIEKYLPDHIEQSIDKIFTLYKNYNEKLPEDLRRPDKDFAFLSHFYKSFIADRTKRVVDVNTPEHERATNLANSLLPMNTLAVLCMDGRVKMVHTNGFTADIGSAIRTPGGLLNEFIRQDGELTLDLNSNFANLLLDALSKSQNIAEVFDSHFSCAARTGEEAATGNFPGDAGLLRDVLHKKEMIKTTKKMLAGKKEFEGKHIVFIQTTYNPITGYMYMGLEREEALAYAKSVASQEAIAVGKNPVRAAQYAQYTKGVLSDLINKGEIISTGALIDDPTIKNAFEQHSFPINRQEDYVRSEVNFWENMAKLKKELLPYIEQVVRNIYPHLTGDNKTLKRELEQRAMLLLTNMYNTYLHNPNHHELEYLEMDDHDYEKQDHYPYGIHNEEGVKVSEGGHPPYDIPMFVVYSGDIENLSQRIELASGLVRKNRLDGRVVDRSGNYTDAEEFTAAPVPLVMQEIVRDKNGTRITTQDWEHLEKIDWEDLPKEWDTMTDDEFDKYLIAKGLDSHLLIKGIQNVRHKMARIYDPSQESSSHLRDLYKTVLPIVCDQKRKTHAIIPFIKVGREKD